MTWLNNLCNLPRTKLQLYDITELRFWQHSKREKKKKKEIGGGGAGATIHKAMCPQPTEVKFGYNQNR
jgi:hypothetical protein